MQTTLNCPQNNFGKACRECCEQIRPLTPQVCKRFYRNVFQLRCCHKDKLSSVTTVLQRKRMEEMCNSETGLSTFHFHLLEKFNQHRPTANEGNSSKWNFLAWISTENCRKSHPVVRLSAIDSTPSNLRPLRRDG